MLCYKTYDEQKSPAVTGFIDREANERFSVNSVIYEWYY